ncbi:MAG: hypothetical protein IPP15_12795 [Saprospiraceae bacterium]|uniref:C2H2-type domain-containing protein n=1 Tax=Candidatus Opimibacter skivensis TaxID=2982028 RepID=A0A9D7XNE0_9BACT|nr:hypothetical protein [Candidatus Opimibacter skivensis]
MTERFADPGVSLYQLATHFIVHCPKCDGKAQVLPFNGSWKLTCSKCFHVELPGHWYGSMTAYVSVKCRVCHQSISRSAEVTGEWAKLKVKCDECGDECEYEAKISRHYMHHGLMCDSVFGLPLWLQKEFRSDLFWAFNYEHLSLLEQYVRAKLRERGIENKGSKNSLMFSRLPTFITSAKNRGEILKLIEELSVK